MYFKFSEKKDESSFYSQKCGKDTDRNSAFSDTPTPTGPRPAAGSGR